MSKVLVINGHPTGHKESSKTLKGLETFLEIYRQNNPNDEIIEYNLYEDNFPEIDTDLFGAMGTLMNGGSFDDLSNSQKENLNRFNNATQDFIEADKVIIANPLWNLMVTTKLKAWVDSINVAGKTFKYTETGPVSLVEGKKAVHIQSAGGVYNNQDMGSQYIKGILEFLGTTDFTKLSIEGIDFQPDNAEAIMNKALEEIKATAESF